MKMTKIKATVVGMALAFGIMAAPSVQTAAHADPLSSFTPATAMAHDRQANAATPPSGTDPNDVSLSDVISTGTSAAKAEIMYVAAGLVVLVLTVALIGWGTGRLGSIAGGRKKV